MKRSELVENTIRRFQHLGNRTIANHLIANYGDLFKNDIEVARSAVRHHRKKFTDTPEIAQARAIALPSSWSKARHDHRLQGGLWGYMSDVHIPFHDSKPIEAAIQWFHANSINGILLNGDILDCAAVGFWPQESRDLDKEIEAYIDFFDFLRSEFPTIPIVFKYGNHENRNHRYFITKAPELATSPFAAMETVLGLDQRNIEMIPHKQKIKAGGLSIMHGDEVAISSAVNPARGLFLKAKTSALVGHFHRTSEHVESNLDGVLTTCWSVGCMCGLSPDYVPYGHNWNWGAALINVTDPKSKLGGFEVENRRITPSGKLK